MITDYIIFIFCRKNQFLGTRRRDKTIEEQRRKKCQGRDARPRISIQASHTQVGAIISYKFQKKNLNFILGSRVSWKFKILNLKARRHGRLWYGNSKHCIFSSGAYFYSMFDVKIRFEGFLRESGPLQVDLQVMKNSKIKKEISKIWASKHPKIQASKDQKRYPKQV